MSQGRVKGVQWVKARLRYPSIVNDEELLLREICWCPNIAKAQQNSNHPCYEIVNLQDPDSDEFQIPEPWSGDLTNARLLCIASNPSINPEEYYPSRHWSDTDKVDFFRNRFSPSSRWTDRRKVLLSDGESYTKRPVSYWSKVHAQARRAYGRTVSMGSDYAITEVVHCKSKKELNVETCRETCWNLWMPSILRVSKANVLMLLGKHATDWFESSYCSFNGSRVIEDIHVCGKIRTIVTLPHPTSWEPLKKMDELLTTEEMEIIRKRLTS